MSKVIFLVPLIWVCVIGFVEAGCFKTWQSWTACSISCGGGVQRRIRDPTGQCRVNDNSLQQSRRCGKTCLNGGTFVNDACSCASRWTGKCCEAHQFCHINNGGCSGVCNMADNGVSVCGCTDGYQLKADAVSCADIDECSQNKCGHECTNTVGSFQCSCRHGYRLGPDNMTCTDVDECTTGTSHCDHTCTNIPGSFFCKCSAGYALGSDGHSCSDINECATDNGGCPHVCVNEPGTFHCECKAGYRQQPENEACIDRDECAEHVSGCSHDCQNTEGYFVCQCPSGYTLNSDGKLCEENIHCIGEICRNGGSCAETRSSYTCVCATGFTGRHCEMDINECTGVLPKGGCEDECVNTVGSFLCKCGGTRRLSGDGRSCDGGAPVQSVFRLHGIARKMRPKGCSVLSLSHLATSEDASFRLYSTSSWYRLRQNTSISYTNGIVFAGTNTISIPLSMTGAAVTHEPDMPIVISNSMAYTPDNGQIIGNTMVSNCTSFEVTQDHVRQLLVSNSFHKSFFDSIESVLPSWLRFSNTIASIDPSDLQTHIGFGRDVHANVWCRGAPLVDHHRYAVLQLGSDLSISVYGHTLKLPRHASQKYCFIIDLSDHAFGTVYVMIPEDARAFIDQIHVLKQLYDNHGIRISLRGIGFSVGQTITVARPNRVLEVWGGDEVLEHTVISDANLWIGGDAQLDIGVLHMKAETDMYFAIPTSNHILHSLYFKEWEAYHKIEYSAEIDLTFRLFGNQHTITLLNSGAASIEAITAFGGVERRQWCGSSADPSGLFLEMPVNLNPFNTVPFLKYLNFGRNDKLFVFFPISPTNPIIKQSRTAMLDSIIQVDDNLRSFSHLTENVSLFFGSQLDFKQHRYIRQLGEHILSSRKQIASMLNGNSNPDILIEALENILESATDVVHYAKQVTDSIEFDTQFSSLSKDIFSKLNSLRNAVQLTTEKLTSLMLTSVKNGGEFGIRFQAELNIFGLEFDIMEFEFLYSVQNILSCERYNDISEIANGVRYTRVYGMLPTLWIGLGRFLTLHKAGFEWSLSIDEPDKTLIRLIASVEIFGANVDVNVYIDQHGLRFNAVCPIWNGFVAELNVSAIHGRNWNDLVYEVDGLFKTDSVNGNNFGDSYLDKLREHISYTGQSANQRLTQAQSYLIKAQSGLTSAQNWLTEKQVSIRSAHHSFDEAVAALERAKDKVESAKGPFLSAIDKLNDAERAVDNLCKIKSCGKVCVPGLKCRICHKKIWFVNVPYPCCHTTSCMFSFPNPICVVANVGCRALQGIAYAGIETAKLFVKAPLLVLNTAKYALSAAQFVVDKSRVVLDIAIGALELAKGGLEGAKGMLEDAKLALEGVKTVVKLGVKVFNLVVKYTLQKLVDVKNCGFKEQLYVDSIAIFSVFCDVNALQMGWRRINFTINFKDIIQTLWQAAKATVKILLEAFGSSLVGRQKRELAVAATATTHRFIRHFQRNSSDDIFEYIPESFDVTSQTTGFRTTGDFDEASVRIEIFQEKCHTFVNITTFFGIAVDMLFGMINETTDEFMGVSSMENAPAEQLNLNYLQGNMTLETCGVNVEIAFRKYNLTTEDLLLELEKAKTSLLTDPLLTEMQRLVSFANENTRLRYDDVTNTKIINHWILAMENTSKQYFSSDVCVAFLDCSHFAISQLYDIFYAENLPNTTKSLELISNIEDLFLDLLGNTSSNLEHIYLRCSTIEAQMEALQEIVPFCSDAPIIVSPMMNRTVVYGQSVSLLCNATGQPQLKYWWYKDDVPIPHEHGKILRISNTTTTDAAHYSCVAGNIVANRTSSAALITVVEPTVRNATMLPDETEKPSNNVVTIAYVVGSAVATMTVIAGWIAWKKR